MEMCEVLAKWLENPIKTRNVSEKDCERFYVNNVEVNPSEFVDTEATLAGIIAGIAEVIAEEALNTNVETDFDPDIGNYLDIKSENGEVLFSVKVADIEELRTPDSYKLTTTWRPLKEVILSTIEAIKGYIASKQL